MADQKLDFGEAISGLLVDGVEETPYVGATLLMRDPTGVRVEVPFIHRDPTGQFTHVDEWFDAQNPPANMLLRTDKGAISLFDIRWAGHSLKYGSSSISRGTLDPTEAVLHRRDGALSDPLAIQEVRSNIDGLAAWSRLTAITDDREHDEQNKVTKLILQIKGDEGISWTQGEAKLTIRTDWTTERPEDGAGSRWIIHDLVVLESTFADGPRPFYDHLVEQRKVANLLVLLFGKPVQFRKHRVRDERFADRMNDGKVYHHPFVELISARTVRERAQPIPEKKEMRQPVASMTQVGADGLARWSNEYDKWERFILPSVSVLGRRGAFIEDVVVSTSVALEAAGQIIGARDGEAATYNGRGKPTTATNVYRCLHLLNIAWGDYVTDIVGLAKAIANNYNDVKHYDRGDLPSHDETYLVSTLNRWIVRLLALTLTGKGDELLEEYRQGNGLWTVRQRFEGYKLRVTGSGKFESTDEQNDDELTS